MLIGLHSSRLVSTNHLAGKARSAGKHQPPVVKNVSLTQHALVFFSVGNDIICLFEELVAPVWKLRRIGMENYCMLYYNSSDWCRLIYYKTPATIAQHLNLQPFFCM